MKSPWVILSMVFCFFLMEGCATYVGYHATFAVAAIAIVANYWQDRI